MAEAAVVEVEAVFDEATVVEVLVLFVPIERSTDLLTVAADSSPSRPKNADYKFYSLVY